MSHSQKYKKKQDSKNSEKSEHFQDNFVDKS